MKILVTGNSGYIGTHLCTELLARGYDVLGMDINPCEPSLNYYFSTDIRRINYTLNVDVVIHLAALVRVGESEIIPHEYYDTNIMGTKNIIDKVRCKHFILASTGAAELCNNPYGRSKRAAEDVVATNVKTYTIFRFYNVIGSTVKRPTNPDGLFSSLCNAKNNGGMTIFGNDYDTRDGTAIRDYVHVMEIVEALIAAIDNPTNAIENLGHGVGYTVKEIVNKFKGVNGIDFPVSFGPRRLGDAPISVLNNPSKFMVSRYSLEEMLRVNLL